MAGFPPGLGWIRWGRGPPQPAPWLGRVEDYTRPRRCSLQSLLRGGRTPVPMATQRGPARSTGEAEGGGASSPALKARPRPERVPRASPPGGGRSGAVQGGSSAGAEHGLRQQWLRVSPALWSPAAPPPSPGTGWCNVSNWASGPGCKAELGATGPGPPLPALGPGSRSSAGVCAWRLTLFLDKVRPVSDLGERPLT